MKPLNFSLKVDAIDHYIYNGFIFIAMSDGGIIAVSIDEIFEKLITRYYEYKDVIILAFRRSSYWSSDAAKCFLNFSGVRRELRKIWKKALEELNFELSIDELDGWVIVPELSSTLLHMSIYANRLYLCCVNGFYSVDISTFSNQKLYKLFDAKTYYVAPGYGRAILSLGEKGMKDANAFELKSLDDRLVSPKSSFLTSWTMAGGLMNYSGERDLCFFGNKLKQDKEVPDNWAIERFGVNINDDIKIVDEDNRIFNKHHLSLGFNSRTQQFLISNKGKIYQSKLNVSQQEISLIRLKEIDKRLGQSAISGHIVANQFPVVEFLEKTVLIQDNKRHILEDEMVVSIHTYPNSNCFKDIISITKEDKISIHAVDLIDSNLDDLFPNIDRIRKQKYFK